jgi:uncharacterized membrane protein YeaQ/YmgE (transglycosylase-associated protein family)
MVLVLLLAVIVGFVIIAALGWALWLVITTAITGLVVGALGRLILPGRQPIGVFATIVCGLAASLVGSAIGQVAGLHHWATILVEIGTAALAVGVWSRAVSRRTAVTGTGPHRVINI